MDLMKFLDLKMIFWFKKVKKFGEGEIIFGSS